MGGDHHHVQIPKVPDPSIYKIEDSELLMDIQKRLADKGLKDPWLRNYVWRTQLPKKFSNPKWVLLKGFTYGWQIWVPALAITFAVESFLGIDYNHHGHDHGHDDKGHH